MPKYLIAVSYTPEGMKGLVKEGGAARKAAAQAAIEGVGGRLEAMYFALGQTDAIVIADIPDTASLVALSLTVNGSGALRATTTELLSIEEFDAARRKSVTYRPPGA